MPETDPKLALRVKELIGQGVEPQQAIAQAQEEASQTLGVLKGDVPQTETLALQGGQSQGGRGGILQALAAAAQRPPVEAPTTEAPDPRLRIIQALSSAGSGLLGLRDQAGAEKRNRAAQATANVVNALSKGRAGARATQEEARPGLLTRLAAIPGQAAGAGLQIQADQQAADQQTFENQVSAEGKPFTRINSLLQRMQEEERIGQAGGRLEQGNTRLEQSNRRVTEGETAGAARRKDKDEDQALAIRQQELAESRFAWDKKKAEMDLAAELPDSKMVDALNEAGRAGLTLDQVLEDNDLRPLYNAYSPSAKTIFKQAITEGARLHKAELDAKIKALRGSGSGSATERMAINDAETFKDELDELQRLWRGAGMKGFTQGVFKMAGIGFDPEEDTGSLFMRRVFDDSANLSDALAGFGLKIARILNGGRPSDRDLIAARRLLPLQSDQDELAQKKFVFLQTIFQKRVDAIRNQMVVSFGPAEGESDEDYIARAMNNPSELREALTVEAQEGTTQEGVDLTKINLGGR